jgi:hypothetical protein
MGGWAGPRKCQIHYQRWKVLSMFRSEDRPQILKVTYPESKISKFEKDTEHKLQTRSRMNGTETRNATNNWQIRLN